MGREGVSSRGNILRKGETSRPERLGFLTPGVAGLAVGRDWHHVVQSGRSVERPHPAVGTGAGRTGDAAGNTRGSRAVERALFVDHDRARAAPRILPAVLAVAFSDLLITVQVGLLLGALAVLSLPIDHSEADVWVASPGVLSLELGYPIPESWRSRLASMRRGRGHGELPLRLQLLAQAAGAARRSAA